MAGSNMDCGTKRFRINWSNGGIYVVLFLIAVNIWFVLESLKLPVGPVKSVPVYLPPRLYGITALIMLLGVLFFELKGSKKEEPASDDDLPFQAGEAASGASVVYRHAVFVISAIIWVVLVNLWGMILPALLIMPIIMYLLGVRQWQPLILIPLCTNLIIIAVFVWYLNLPVPLGVLAPLGELF